MVSTRTWSVIALLAIIAFGLCGRVTCVTLHRGKTDLMYCEIGNSFDNALSKIPQEEQEDDDFGPDEKPLRVRSHE